jgi:hypothetical protein
MKKLCFTRQLRLLLRKIFLTACQRFVWRISIKYISLVSIQFARDLVGLSKFKICNGTDGAELWGGGQFAMRQSFMY